MAHLMKYLYPDIQPLRPGHTLVIPKTHEPRVSELPAEFAAAVGVAVSKVSNAIAQGNGDGIPLCIDPVS